MSGTATAPSGPANRPVNTPQPQAPNGAEPAATQAAPSKPRRKRSASVPRAAFFIVQIMDENGEPMPFDKKRVKLVSVERSAEKVMELMENGTHPNAFYLRGLVPVSRPGQTGGSPG